MKPLAAFAIVSLGLGCSSAVTPSPPSSSSPGSSPSIPMAIEPSDMETSSGSLLGSLRTRDRHVLLFASSSGMKVTIKASDGALIADRIDLESLRALDPSIYEICRSGIASRGSYVDATLDARMRSSESRDEPRHMTPRGRP